MVAARREWPAAAQFLVDAAGLVLLGWLLVAVPWPLAQAQNCTFPSALLFGQTADISGPTQRIAQELRLGLEAAFNETNDIFCGVGGFRLLLKTLDNSGSVLQAVNDTETLVGEGVLAIVGVTNSQAAIHSSNITSALGVPFLGAFTGASELRKRVSKYTINIRGSFVDETLTMLNYIANVLHLTSMSVFYQADSLSSYGYLNQLPSALAFYGLNLCSYGTYAADDNYNITIGVDDVLHFATPPQIIGMIGTYNVMADFVSGIVDSGKLPNVRFILSSYAGADPFAEELKARNISTVTPNGQPRFYMTQVVPNPANTSLQLVDDFHTALNRIPLPANYSRSGAYVAFEGYMTGRLIIQAMQAVRETVNMQPASRGDLANRTTFVSTFWQQRSYLLSGVSLGPYAYTVDGCNASDDNSCCNQGSHVIYVTSLAENYLYQNNQSDLLYFPGCNSQPAYVDLQQATSSGGLSALTTAIIVAGTVLGVCVLLLALAGALAIAVVRRKLKQKALAYQRAMAHSTPLAMLDSMLDTLERREGNQEQSFDPESSPAFENGDVELGLTLNKTLLDFGIDRRKQCPVNALLTDTLILANTGKKPLRVRLYYPYRSHKFSLLFNAPPVLKIKPKKEKAIVVEMVVKLTTVIDQPVYIEVEDIGHTLLNIKLESELSTLLDYEEIAVQGPAIGIGGFGRVFKGTWRGGEVAVKVLKDQNPSEREMDQFQREIDMMNKLRHKNIVNFIGAVTVPGKLCMVTEFAKHGSLQDALSGRRKKMSKLLQAKIALDIANGLNFLHQSGILHRDIKPDNVLMFSFSSKADINAKLTDFGTSRAVGAAREDMGFTKGLGTPIYMAPEILAHQDYSEKADVYSFGLLLWSLCSGTEPYKDFTRSWDIARFVTAGKRLDLPKGTSGVLAHLITTSWAQDPDERYSFAEIAEKLQALVNVKKYSKQSPESSSGSAQHTGGSSLEGFGVRDVWSPLRGLSAGRSAGVSTSSTSLQHTDSPKTSSNFVTKFFSFGSNKGKQKEEERSIEMKDIERDKPAD